MDIKKGLPKKITLKFKTLNYYAVGSICVAEASSVITVDVTK
jgi:hypothetical protein